MNKFTTTITVKGQVTVPAQIRHKLGLNPSDRLRVHESKGQIILEKDDYWAEFDRLQKKVQSHRSKKGVMPLTIEEIKSLRDASWGDKTGT